MEIIKCFRKPEELKVIKITKKELENLPENVLKYLSISKDDKEWIETLNDNDIVGVINGQIDKLKIEDNIYYDNDDSIDIWLVNINYFKKNFIEGE